MIRFTVKGLLRLSPREWTSRARALCSGRGTYSLRHVHGTLRASSVGSQAMTHTIIHTEEKEACANVALYF